MGNSQSNNVVYPMPSFQDYEYDTIKRIVGDCIQKEMNEFIPLVSNYVKEQLTFFPENLKNTFIYLVIEEEKLLNIKYKNPNNKKSKNVKLNSEDNELLSRSIVLRVIDNLCRGEKNLKKRYLQIYSSKYNKTPKEFINELAKTGISYYNHNHSRKHQNNSNSSSGSGSNGSGGVESMRIIETSDRIVNYIVNEITKSNQNNNDDIFETNKKNNIELTWDMLIKDFEKSHIFQLLWEITFNSEFLISQQYKEANFHNYRVKNWLRPNLLNVRSKLLRPEDVFILDININSKYLTNTWNLIYDSHTDGHNWTVFSNKIEEKGSTLLIIKDSKGNIFGGFASQEWKHVPDFYGDNDSFLFTISPEINVYKSSDYNNHFQYFNDQTKTLPNGLGMGGQLDYFGLWIDHDFAKGHSKGVSITYNNPSLCGDNSDFKIDSIEVWCVKEKEVDERLIPDKKKKGSALDRIEDMAMLEMCGVNLYSKDVRATKISLSSSEDSEDENNNNPENNEDTNNEFD